MSSSIVTATVTHSSSSAHIVPTATDTYPRNTMPTSISYARSAIPTTLPQVISPPDGLPSQPANTTLVQIGFSYALNYHDVLANNVTQKQMFFYVTRGIASGMNLDEGQITMQCLRAYDTTKSLAYVTTLACFYLPSSNVSSLQSQLDISKTRNANTPLYDNPDPSINSIMALVNPGIPVTAGAVLNSSLASATTSASATAPTPTPKSSHDGLSSGSRISIGVMVPVAIIAIFLLGLLFWRRRKSSSHNANKSKQTAEEKDTDSRIYEMAASMRRFELQEGEHEHYLQQNESYESCRAIRGADRSCVAWSVSRNLMLVLAIRCVRVPIVEIEVLTAVWPWCPCLVQHSEGICARLQYGLRFCGYRLAGSIVACACLWREGDRENYRTLLQRFDGWLGDQAYRSKSPLIRPIARSRNQRSGSRSGGGDGSIAIYLVDVWSP